MVPAGPPGYRRLIFTYLGPLWLRVLLLGCMLGLSISLELLNPQIVRWFIDDAAVGNPLSDLVWIALLYIGAAIALQAVHVAEVYVAQYIGLTATNRMRADLTRLVLSLDPSFHATHTPGELIERTDGDVSTLANFFARLIVYLLGNGLLLIGTLFLLVRIDWRVGMVAVASAVLGIGLTLWLRRVSVWRFAALRQANADLFGMIEERLAGTEDVRANGGVGYVLRRFLERSRHLVWMDVTTQMVSRAAFQSAGLSLSLGTVAALAVAVYLFQRGEITIGTVYLIFAYTQNLRRPIEAISRQLEDLQQALASIGRVSALLGERSTIVDGPGAVPPTGSLGVQFDRVTFAYGDREPILRDLSFDLQPGQVLGLLGRTGSGKTTIARLLFRLYDPGVGAIRLGGVDLRQSTVQALRDRIGIVTQDIQLFHASVRDNITFFDHGISDRRITSVLEEVGLGPWLNSLPEGLETMLAPGGSGLSAGEAQLLAFARVFLKDPGLVVLDEASSRLDPTTERLLEQAIDRLLAGRTAIVIAHRLATIERADRVLILEDGRIAEEGTRAALAADPASRFSRLIQVGLDAREILS